MARRHLSIADQTLPIIPAGSSPPDEDLRESRGLLAIACVFAGVGGYMDAYSYLAHGQVFANAQTDNVVFLALYASGGQWKRAAGHLPSIAAFALGVAAAKLVGAQNPEKTFRPTLFCQAVELVILSSLATVADRLPDPCIVPVIAFVAALQNTSFSTIGAWSFNSSMTTGNLRTATSGLVLWLAGRDRVRNRAKAIALGAICLAFFLGALAGGICTRWDARHALWPCAALVAVGLIGTWRERRQLKGEQC